MDKITSFTGQFQFLRNDFPTVILVGDDEYPSVEHAFQASKTTSQDIKDRIKEVSAKEAKEIGNCVDLSASWDEDRLIIMETLVRQKFYDDDYLSNDLLETDNNELIQTGQDLFWGVDTNGFGENNMGKILMKIRKEILFNRGKPDLIKKINSDQDIIRDYLDLELVHDISEPLNEILSSVHNILILINNQDILTDDLIENLDVNYTNLVANIKDVDNKEFDDTEY